MSSMIKKCVCKHSSTCATYVTKWTILNDNLRCGYYRVPSYNPTGDEQCLDNKIRDVIFHYLFDGSRTGEKLARPCSDTTDEIQYVAFHHFSPRILQINNEGPLMFLTKDLADELELNNVRTVLFTISNEEYDAYRSNDIEVGKYISAPNYSWRNTQSDLSKIESMIEQYSKTKSGEDEKEASSHMTLVNLIIDRDWIGAYKRCKIFPDEAKQWVVSTSRRTGNVFVRKLPIHFACRFSAPKEVIVALVDAYPAGLEALDESGKLPIHDLFHRYHKATDDKKKLLEIVEYMLAKYPESTNIADLKGMLPIHRASSIGIGDEVVNKLFISNQRSVMVRDSKGRMPRHLVNRAYERKRIKARLIARKREEEMKLHEKEETETIAAFKLKSQQSNTINATSEESVTPRVTHDSTNPLFSAERSADDCNKFSLIAPERTDEQDSNEMLTSASQDILIQIKSNDEMKEQSTSEFAIKFQMSKQKSHSNVKITKKFVRLNRSKRAVKKLVTSDEPLVIENFTCMSKKDRKLKKEMKKLRKITENSMVNKTVESFTCLSKKDRKLKKEIERLQRLTEEALSRNYVEADMSEQDNSSVSISLPSIDSMQHTVKPISSKSDERFSRKSKRQLKNRSSDEPLSIESFTCMSPKDRKLRNEMKRLQYITEKSLFDPQDEEPRVDMKSHKLSTRNKKRTKVRVGKLRRRGKKASDPVSIESFTCMSTKKNKKLKHEVEEMQRIVEEAIKNQESVDINSPLVVSNKTLKTITAPSTPENDEGSVFSSSNASFSHNSVSTHSNTVAINQYTCTSGKKNKKLKKEMKKMQKLMREELGQPEMQSKSKLKKLKKSILLKNRRVTL